MNAIKSIFFMLPMPALLVGDHLTGHGAFLFVYGTVILLVTIILALVLGIFWYTMDPVTMTSEQATNLRKVYEPLKPLAIASLMVNLGSIGWLLYSMHLKAALAVALFTALVYAMRHVAKAVVEMYDELSPEDRELAKAVRSFKRAAGRL